MPSSTRRTKRKSSPEKCKEPLAKRQRKDKAQNKTGVIVIEDSEPEDEELKEILAQIKESEKQEVLFQEGSSSGNKDHPIDLEDDAALARQLAEEWTAEDAVLQNGHKDADVGYSSEVEFVSHTPVLSGSMKKRSDSKSTSPDAQQRPADATARPDEALAEHRDLFTAVKPCSKCSKAMKPPRGCVSLVQPSLFFQ